MYSRYGAQAASFEALPTQQAAQHAAAAFGFLRHADGAAQTGPQRAAQHGALVGGKTALGLHTADESDGDVFHALSFSGLPVRERRFAFA